MNENVEEQLSALMDGECSAAETDSVLDALKRDPQLRARWSRYHLASSAIKRELPLTFQHDLAARVSTAVDAEPTVLAPHHRSRKSAKLVQHVTTFAVAASLTAVAILGIQRLTQEGQLAPESPQIAAAPSAAEGQAEAGQAALRESARGGDQSSARPL